MMDIEKMERMYLAGASYNDICAECRITKGQLVGHIYRHKARLGSRTVTMKGGRPRKDMRKSHAALPAEMKKIKLKGPPASVLKPVPVLQETNGEELSPLVASIIELERGQCNWPIGEGYCGRVTEEKQRWCPVHRSRGTEAVRGSEGPRRGLRGKVASWRGA